MACQCPYEADDIADRKLLEQMGREVRSPTSYAEPETLAMVEKLRTFRFGLKTP